MSDLDHYAHQLNQHCTNLSYELRRVGGEFDKIEGRIEDGSSSHELDTTSLNLRTAEGTLRSLANEISVLRRRLSENLPKVA